MIRACSEANLNEYLVIKEDGEIISPTRCMYSSGSTGQRIPPGFTFSVLVDLSIPEEGKGQIFDAVKSNVVFALAVKGLILLLSALGYASMWAAVFGDVGVALLCVLNSMRMMETK